MTKTLAAQVRKILRDTGVCTDSYSLWTNKYKHCRTVKCYAPKDEELIIDAAELIEQLCIDNGVPFQMKVHNGMSTWFNPTRSVIVRLPLDV